VKASAQPQKVIFNPSLGGHEVDLQEKLSFVSLRQRQGRERDRQTDRQRERDRHRGREGETETERVRRRKVERQKACRH
jgi:hypothetical protein